METIGLIAGNGGFPLLFARAARTHGFSVVAVAHRGETDEAIAAEVDHLVWIRVGQIGRAIRAFRRAGVERAVLAGGVNKARSMLSFRPDLRALRLLRQAVRRGDDALLRAFAAEFEREGIRIVPSTLFLDEIVAGCGRIVGPEPDRQARSDIEIGRRVLSAVGSLDIGQCVVVERGVVLAIEAIEGTDETIRRGAALGSGKAVVVKGAKPGQDMRFDVPAIGPRTVETMAAAGVRVLAVEAGKTIMLDTDRLTQLADSHGIAVLGFASDEAKHDE